MMGAAGRAEYDYWDDDDDDDDESVLASDLEDEEIGKPSKPGQAKEEMLQVTAWLDEARPSRIDEQRMAETLGKRRRSWLVEVMRSRIPKTLRSVPDSSSQAGIYSDSGLLSAQDSRQGSVITL
jgi:hypothetical protein